MCYNNGLRQIDLYNNGIFRRVRNRLVFSFNYNFYDLYAKYRIFFFFFNTTTRNRNEIDLRRGYIRVTRVKKKKKTGLKTQREFAIRLRRFRSFQKTRGENFGESIIMRLKARVTQH